MAKVPNNIDFSQSGNSVFENVYIYDTLYVNKLTTGSGDGSIDLDNLNVRNKFTVGPDKKLFNVDASTGNIGINTLNPDREIVAIGSATINGNVDIVGPFARLGIGSDYVDPNNERQLEIGHSVKISKFIYDKNDGIGKNTSVLSRDETGIIWRELSTEIQEGIFLQEDGENVGGGVSFSTINFVEKDSLGISTEVLGITSSGNVGLATIFSNDYWGNSILIDDTNTGIYRLTNVGIFTNTPIIPLQIGVSTADYDGSVGILTVTTSSSHGLETDDVAEVKNITFQCDSGQTVYPKGSIGYNFPVHKKVSDDKFEIVVGLNTRTHTYVSGGTIQKQVNYQSTETQLRDLSIQGEPSGGGFNNALASCSNVVSSIYTCVGIVTGMIQNNIDGNPTITGFTTTYPGGNGVVYNGKNPNVGILTASLSPHQGVNIITKGP